MLSHSLLRPHLPQLLYRLSRPVMAVVRVVEGQPLPDRQQTRLQKSSSKYVFHNAHVLVVSLSVPA